jgi:L-fuconolactonase
MKIDSHNHFWKFDTERHSWIDGSMKAIQHDFLPHTLQPILESNNFDGTVVVQVDQNEAENEFLLDLAAQNSFIKGVVGWVDFAAPDLGEQLEKHKKNPAMKGFRHILQGENVPEFLSNDTWVNGIGQLEKFGFTYDVLIFQHQMADALAFVKKFPNQPFVLDHIAKPTFKEADWNNWTKHMKLLAQNENMMCKLSGMVTENDWNLWNESDFTPYMEVALETFGPNRLMFGSDWPVCILAAAYDQVHEIVDNFVSKLSKTEQSAIWGGNAAKFYGLQ